MSSKDGRKKFVGWYELSEEQRDKIFQIHPNFQELRHSWQWSKNSLTENTREITTRTTLLMYDWHMPLIKEVMEIGIKVAVCAVNCQYLDVTFILPKEEKKQ